MTLGQVMQAASAFTIVQAAFNWLVDNYPRLADWTASARRVVLVDGVARRHWSAPRTARASVESARRNGRGQGRVAPQRSFGDARRRHRGGRGRRGRHRARASACWSPANPAPARARWCAPSRGCGRGAAAASSSHPERRLIHAAAASLCARRHAAPRGRLSRCRRRLETIEEIGEALEKVGLGHLAKRIEEEAPWDQTLSGGEKQRLAFARIFLHKPDIVVLDEATSALDPESQDKLMALLTEQRAGTRC